MRIAVAGFQHETNTFGTDITEAEAFVAPSGWPRQLRGNELLTELPGTSVATAGALDRLAKSDATIVPLFWTIALPSGPVRHSAYEAIASEILDRLAAALPVDGVFLELHGAMATTEDGDAEGDFLTRVRALVGPDVPISVALDLHCNLSARMVEAADALCAYLTYPHIDMADTGVRAIQTLLDLCDGAPRPAKAFRQLPYLLPLVAQATGADPVARLYAAAARTCGRVMLTMGFPLADVADAGPAIATFAPSQPEAAALADEMLDGWLAAEAEFNARLYAPDEAVARAKAAKSPLGPVVIADVQDNPGGGGSNDTTGLLRALIDGGAEGALLVHIADPEALSAAQSAGEGATLSTGVGGKTDPETGAPVPGPWTVLALRDGNFTGEGPMYGGAAIRMGPVALLEHNGVRVIVAGQRMQASEPGLIRHLGLSPEDLPILCVKSSVHFRGAYQDMAADILLAAAPGLVQMDLASLTYRNSRRRPAGANQNQKLNQQET